MISNFNIKRITSLFLSMITILTFLLTGCADNNLSSENDSDSSFQVKENTFVMNEIRDNFIENFPEYKKNIEKFFFEVCEIAHNELGKEHNLTKLLDFAYNANLFSDKENVVYIIYDIICNDTNLEEDSFIGENLYLFDNNDLGYKDIYPVYDFYTGLCGLYNVATNEYVYDVEYSSITHPDELGYMSLCYQGYYGCVDLAGNKVVGFMYDSPIIFDNELAIIEMNDKCGVIDKFGTEILKPKYGNISIIDNGIIAANNLKNGLGEVEYSEIALFTYDGVQKTNNVYCDVKIINNRVFAKYNNGDVKLDDVYHEDWYDLYDLNLNRLIGEGTSLPEVWGVKLPNSVGTMVAVCDGEITNEYGVEYPRNGFVVDDYGYRFITKDLQRINQNVYEPYIKNFNGLGYAIANVYNKSEREYVSVIIDSNGNQIDAFRLDDCDWYMPYDANDYVYKMSYYSPNTNTIQYAICNRKNRKLALYPNIEMIDGTNLAIVQDNETKLYGLYDGETLALDTIYTDIYFYDDLVYAKRGGEEITYTPQF